MNANAEKPVCKLMDYNKYKYEKAKKMIDEHRDILDKCASLLLEKEKISKDEFEALFND